MKKIKAEELTRNAFQMIGTDWLLLTAKSGETVNTMTASWGGVGIMWGKPVAYVFIRPQRFTKTLIDAEKEFSISIMNDSYRDKLRYFGTKSGRDENKVANSGLALAEEHGVPYYADAEIAMIAKKLYVQPMSGDNLTEEGAWVNERWYPGHDWHHMYVVELTDILVKE